MSKPPKNNQSCMCDNERLVFRQTSIGVIEALIQEAPMGARTRRVALGRPTSLRHHPRSLDQAMNNNIGG